MKLNVARKIGKAKKYDRESLFKEQEISVLKIHKMIYGLRKALTENASIFENLCKVKSDFGGGE